MAFRSRRRDALDSTGRLGYRSPVMKINTVLPAIAAVAGVVAIGTFGAVAPGAGCGADACAKDTDCPMPQVCIASRCVAVPAKQDAFDAPPPDAPDAEGGDDIGDVDADEIPEGTDVTDGEIPEGGDEATPCTPGFPASGARRIIDPTVADGQERPVMIASAWNNTRSAADGRFAFLARVPATSPAGTHGLRFQRIAGDATLATSPTTPQSGVRMGGAHPFVEVPGIGFAIALTVAGGSAGLYIKITDTSGGGGPVAAPVPGTDIDSVEPAIAFDGTSLAVAWVQRSSMTPSQEIRAGRFNAATGAIVGAVSTVATGTGAVGVLEPRIQWGSDRFLLVYYREDDRAVHLAELDAGLAVTTDNPLPLAADQTFSGYPAVAWSGAAFGVVFETAGPASSTLHFVVVTPGAGDLPSQFEPLSGTPLASTEPGHVAIAWADDRSEWGIAWRYTRSADLHEVAFARVSNEATPTLIEGPITVSQRDAPTPALFPTIAYNTGYYAFAWTEQVGSNYPAYEVTWGCGPVNYLP